MKRDATSLIGGRSPPAARSHSRHTSRASPYRILVAGWQPESESTPPARPAVAPADDDFADARHVPVLYHGNLEDATVQLGEETGRGTQATGWYRILPRHSSRLTLEGRGPGSIPVVGAFTGSRLPSLHRIAERFSTVRFHADRGRMYRVRVDCAGGYVGDYTLDVSDGSVEGQGVHMSVKPGQTLGSVRHHGLRLDVGARRKVDVRVDHRDGLDATLRLTLLDHAPNRVMNVPVQLRRVTMGA